MSAGWPRPMARAPHIGQRALRVHRPLGLRERAARRRLAENRRHSHARSVLAGGHLRPANNATR
eukprot:3779256-Lingulodinium_polyedra.AAC.1